MSEIIPFPAGAASMYGKRGQGRQSSEDASRNNEREVRIEQMAEARALRIEQIRNRLADMKDKLETTNRKKLPFSKQEVETLSSNLGQILAEYERGQPAGFVSGMMCEVLGGQGNDGNISTRRREYATAPGKAPYARLSPDFKRRMDLLRKLAVKSGKRNEDYFLPELCEGIPLFTSEEGSDLTTEMWAYHLADSLRAIADRFSARYQLKSHVDFWDSHHLCVRTSRSNNGIVLPNAYLHDVDDYEVAGSRSSPDEVYFQFSGRDEVDCYIYPVTEDPFAHQGIDPVLPRVDLRVTTEAALNGEARSGYFAVSLGLAPMGFDGAIVCALNIRCKFDDETTGFSYWIRMSPTNLAKHLGHWHQPTAWEDFGGNVCLLHGSGLKGYDEFVEFGAQPLIPLATPVDEYSLARDLEANLLYAVGSDRFEEHLEEECRRFSDKMKAYRGEVTETLRTKSSELRKQADQEINSHPK